MLGSAINEKHKATKFHTNISNTFLKTLRKNVSAAIFSQEVHMTLYQQLMNELTGTCLQQFYGLFSKFVNTENRIDFALANLEQQCEIYASP